MIDRNFLWMLLAVSLLALSILCFDLDLYIPSFLFMISVLVVLILVWKYTDSCGRWLGGKRWTVADEFR